MPRRGSASMRSALLGDLSSARYAHERVEDAYRSNGYDDVLAVRQ